MRAIGYDENPGVSRAACTLVVQPSTAGTILGRATDESSGKPLAGVYIVVGYKGIQRAAITDADGRYTVHGVPAGEPAAILGFHEHNYRYNNSRYDADFVPRLEPGQTITYNFTARQLADPAGQPIVSDPVISTGTARPGDRVQFELTVTGGEGGLSDEVFASSPRLGRIAWLQAAGGDRFRAELTIPSDTLAQASALRRLGLLSPVAVAPAEPSVCSTDTHTPDGDPRVPSHRRGNADVRR